MDLSSFGEARVSELMSRFTYDVDSINQGIQTVIGRAIREPLKMVGLPGRRRLDLLAAVAGFVLLIAADRRLSDFSRLGQNAETGQSQSAGRNVGPVQHSERNASAASKS